MDHLNESQSNGFEDVLWTDESSIQMECHRRFCYRKNGEQAKPKPRPKHPVKVHIWGGISCKGATPIVIFEGIMNADGLIKVLEAGLLPYFRVNQSAKLMQDNDPKHTSRKVKDWLESRDINWWKTPAESPDLNPIENLWHELKEYIRREVKPKHKDELVGGIIEFWKTADVQKCKRYIGHLKKVVPQVIEMRGGPPGY
uniref:Tc1-like transposase DDE domain-containing protein n=1 Tax=Amphimedon queenslandica TaxID=400682 RepID=A0A1X7V786_AMPQE